MVTTQEPSEAEKVEPPRRGDLRKCPVCGSQGDPEAYHCPHCHNYFCFHCRARLLGADDHHQCFNKDCDYYGKLICGVCDEEVRIEEPPAVYLEPEDGYWPLLLLLSVLVAVLAWILHSFLAATLFLFGIFAAGACVLRYAGVNVFGRKNEVRRNRSSVYHKCIRCEQRVKTIPGAG
jgi:hypothetical protein